MSLDVAILGTDGSPKRQVSIGVDDHHRLMQLVGDSPESLLSRIRDYYADAEFGSVELGKLIQEIAILLEKCRQDTGQSSLLNALAQLAELAKSEKQPLVVIAD